MQKLTVFFSSLQNDAGGGHSLLQAAASTLAKPQSPGFNTRAPNVAVPSNHPCDHGNPLLPLGAHFNPNPEGHRTPTQHREMTKT